jgi:hypothetical protein
MFISLPIHLQVTSFMRAEKYDELFKLSLEFILEQSGSDKQVISGLTPGSCLDSTQQ